jgi:hypothetical protein
MCTHTHTTFLVNPRHMREGYDSRSMCVSVAELAATYLVCESKLRCCDHEVPHDVPNTCIVDFAENTLFASFAIIC